MKPDEANVIVPLWQIGSSLDLRPSLVFFYDSSSIAAWTGWTTKERSTDGRQTAFCGNPMKQGERKGVKNILCCITHNKIVSFLREGVSCAVLCNFFLRPVSLFAVKKPPTTKPSTKGLCSKGVTDRLFLLT